MVPAQKVTRGKDRIIGGRQQLDVFKQFLPLARCAGTEGSKNPGDFNTETRSRTFLRSWLAHP